MVVPGEPVGGCESQARWDGGGDCSQGLFEAYPESGISGYGCGTHITNGTPTAMTAATTLSTHQRTHATVTHFTPKAGMQAKTTMLTIVAKPIGRVPRKRDWVG